MKLLTVLHSLTPQEPAEIEVVQHLQEWLCTDYEFHDPPKVGKFYPSGLAYECDRSLAMRFLRAPEDPEEKDPRLQITFEIGHAIHERLQGFLARIAKDRGWQWQSEVRITRDTNPWFISGRVDGEIIIDENQREGVEIKSINDAGFGRLWKAPTDQHLEQGNLYVGLRNLRRMHYIYVNKNTSAMKEFTRPLDEVLFRDTCGRIEDILLTLQDLTIPACTKERCSNCLFYSQRDGVFEDYIDEATLKELEAWRPTYRRRIGVFK